MTTPIIFIHLKNSNYLPYTLAQAKYSNPQSTVFLLGDDSNRYDQIQHALVADYFDSAQEFAQSYQHLSTNPIDYELFCFQRWFILKDFMTRQSLQNCLYLDSDVMLYADASQEHERLKAFEIALPGCVPGSTYINSLNALEKFCESVLNLYRDTTCFQALELKFRQELRSSMATSISDMDAFQFYRDRHPEKVGELLEIVDDSTYDLRVSSSCGFEMLEGVKKLTLVQGHPFGTEAASGKLIRFKSLHFQGIDKHRIKDYFTGESPANWISPPSSISPSVSPALEPENPSTPQAEAAATLSQEEAAEAECNLGLALISQGKAAAAMPYFRSAIQLKPDFPIAYLNLGYALICENQAEAAIAYLKTAIQLNPEYALAYGNLGYAYGELGRREESICCIAMSNALELVELKPDWAETQRNLGLAQQKLGQLESAIAALQKAVELDSNFAEAQVDLDACLYLQARLHQPDIPNYHRQITLKQRNWIIFPDWQQLDCFYQDLMALLQKLLRDPERSQTTLLVDTSNLPLDSELDVEQIVNEAVFELLMTQEMDVDEAPEICPIGHLTSKIWEELLPQVHARILLTQENALLIAQAAVQKLKAVKIEDLS